eukprot:scaffold34409_cov112-Isochrysis_galbana.AAC.1
MCRHLFRLVRHGQLDVSLHPAQQVGPEQVPQHHGAPRGRLHFELGRVCVGAHGNRDGEVLLKQGQRAQLAREDKVEQRPELGQLVLDGGAGQDEPVRCVELLAHLRDLGVRVPDLVPLVQHHVLPRHRK